MTCGPLLVKKDLKMRMQNLDPRKIIFFKSLHRNKAVLVNTATRVDKRMFYQGKADQAQDEFKKEDQRTLYKLAKEFGWVYRSYNGVTKDSDDNQITSWFPSG